MTSKLDVVKAYNDTEDFNASRAYLSDDFQSLDKDGKVVMNKEAYIGMGHMLPASLPDFRFVRSDLRQEGDYVIMTGHFQGTHKADLDLSVMGLGVIPASGKEIGLTTAFGRDFSGDGPGTFLALANLRVQFGKRAIDVGLR